jgi:putative heme degradation protein
MTTENKEIHEIEARRNALQIALRQTDSQAIAHLEAVVGAILSAMTAQNKNKVLGEIAAIEHLAPEVLSIVQLHGESQDGAKPKRQAWREELKDLEDRLNAAQIANSES